MIYGRIAQYSFGIRRKHGVQPADPIEGFRPNVFELLAQEAMG